jgi:hypothetical protein
VAPSIPPKWEPSARQLKQMLAKRRGWLVNPHGVTTPVTPQPPPDHDIYLEESEPAYPEWRVEALNNPERAILLHAKLTRVNLRNAILIHANLGHADLSGADLFGADLSSAELFRADLSSADLRLAKLFDANLASANLSGANLFRADLSDASLAGANLSGADLSAAKLSGAELSLVNLTSARLAYADLAGARYAPVSEPPHFHVVGLRGLSSVKILPHHEIGLVQLRKLLQDAGLRDLEREVTYSIERARTAGLSVFPAIFRWAAFDLTTAYGLHPFRALFLILAIWLFCVPIYSWSIARSPEQSQEASGIYQVLPEKRIDGPSNAPKIEKEGKVVRVQATDLLSAVPAATYFSLLSAVNIGFQQFTPGDWVQRLQPHEYALRAEGWTRIVAGVQALLSVFLLAMWVLTQFGRPFQ